jgi:death-on-curing protein
MKTLNLVTARHVVYLHNCIIGASGGVRGEYNNTRARIDAILAHQLGFLGKDRYKSEFDKAAMLMYFFINGDCFVDGNKRLGLQVGLLMLNMNGIKLTVSEGVLVWRVLSVAKSAPGNHERDIMMLSRWLREYGRVLTAADFKNKDWT